MRAALTLAHSVPATDAAAPAADSPEAVALIERAVRAAVTEAVWRPVLITERYEIGVSDAIDTAVWTHPPHRVLVSTRVLRNARPGLTVGQAEGYVKAHVRHEFGHLLYTERDAERTAKMLAATGATLGTLNWLEDARIEQRERDASGGDPFGWVEYEEHGPVLAHPCMVLAALIFHEGDTLAVAARCDEAAREMLAQVQPLYAQACAAASTLALAPVLARWVALFGNGSEDEQRTRRSGDLLVAAHLAVDEAAAAALAATLRLLVGGAGGGGGSGTRRDRPLERVVLDARGNGEVLAAASSGPVDMGRAQRLAARLAGQFAAESPWEYSSEPGGTLCTRRQSATGEDRYRRAAPTPAARPIVMVIDCSGSMGNDYDGTVPITEARVLVAALSLLAQRGKASGSVVLSAVIRGKATWQRLTLPVPLDAIERIAPRGSAEGLQTALAANTDVIRKAGGRAYVYTDGSIGDEDINKRWLAKRGVRTVGLFAGPEDARDDLLAHFDRAWIRENMERLAAAVKWAA